MSEPKIEQKRSLRSDKKRRHERLCRLIEATIRDEGQPFENQTWAIHPQIEWANRLGVDVRTIRDLIKITPIQSITTHVEGRKAVLLRVGDPGAASVQFIANTMSKLFRQKTGKNVEKHEYGMLIGLAEEWPDGWQVKIFKNMLEEWASFKAAVGLEVAEQREVNGDLSYEDRFHKHPSIAVIRRFSKVALEAYTTHMQAEGKNFPNASYP